MLQVFPVPKLPDGRSPEISDGASSKRLVHGRTIFHSAVDICYRAAAGDPPFTTDNRSVRTKLYYMPENVPFLAVAGGVVTAADFREFGGCVLVRHATGAVSFYAHGAELLVHVGDHVAAGAHLGIIGGSPRAGGGMNFRHLHFEWWPQGTIGSRVDPAPLLKGAAMQAWV